LTSFFPSNGRLAFVDHLGVGVSLQAIPVRILQKVAVIYQKRLGFHSSFKKGTIFSASFQNQKKAVE